MVAAVLPASFAIQCIAVEQDKVILIAHGTGDSAACPDCGTTSDRVHGRYQRHPLDQPWRGWTVRWRLTVRRFVCANRACGRTTFAEVFGPLLPRRAQRLAPCTTLLYAIVCAIGGEAGARLARASGIPISPDTLLRLLIAAPLADASTPRILGVDDFAWRKGRRYGTILLDLETHRPVDLLPNREAETLAAWLYAHPGVEVIARDRAEAYARGARDGAPQAQQIADRFHLVKNASGALDELLAVQRRGRALQKDFVLASSAQDASPLPDLRGPQRSVAHSTARLTRWTRVQELHGRGLSISQIARETELDRKTVRRLVATPEPPLPPPPTIACPGGLTSPLLQPYVAYLQERWQAGCTNAGRLYRELCDRGYRGSYSLLRVALRAWRSPRGPQRARVTRQSDIRWLCLKPPTTLSEEEWETLRGFLADNERIARGYGLVQRFRTIIGGHDSEALTAWLCDAQASDLAPFIGLATSILADRTAVDAAITERWSTGPVEGFIHKLKLLKRQGYGRASFALLRRRVLAA